MKKHGPYRIVCCANMPYAPEAFGTLGTVLVKDGRTITAEDVRDADILAIRSTTRVDEAMLSGSSVRFVGTATIGYDHMDTAYLEKRGIRWCFAPGCNANSVSEYLVSALLCLADKHAFVLEGKTLGVIGVGNVGRKVVDKASALGMRVLLNDPPRERQEPENRIFVPLDRLAAESDIVSFHVPLTRGGPDSTFHMAGGDFLASLKPGVIFMNMARGAVVDTPALLHAIDSGRISHTVMDTWEGEPTVRADLLQRVDLATPHIAGHSFEGKVVGTGMVYREACRFLGVEPRWIPEQHLPAPPVPEIQTDASGRADEAVLWDVVRRIYDIREDDARFRAGPIDAAHFDALRKNYPIRREFQYTRVHCWNAGRRLQEKLRGLGFSL